MTRQTCDYEFCERKTIEPDQEWPYLMVSEMDPETDNDWTEEVIEQDGTITEYVSETKTFCGGKCMILDHLEGFDVRDILQYLGLDTVSQ